MSLPGLPGGDPTPAGSGWWTILYVAIGGFATKMFDALMRWRGQASDDEDRDVERHLRVGSAWREFAEKMQARVEHLEQMMEQREGAFKALLEAERAECRGKIDRLTQRVAELENARG